MSASSSRSVIGFAAASNAEVAGSNPPEKRVRFWFAKVASSNPAWVLLVFETHNFGTGRTYDLWQLHSVTSLNLALPAVSYRVDWEPAATSGKCMAGVPGVFWRCSAVLWGPSIHNPTLV